MRSDEPDPTLELGGISVEEDLAYVRLCGAKAPENRDRRNLALRGLAVLSGLGFGVAVIAAVREGPGFGAGAAVLAATAAFVFYRGVAPRTYPQRDTADLEPSAELDAAVADFLDGVRVGAAQIRALQRGGALLAAALGALVLDVLR